MKIILLVITNVLIFISEHYLAISIIICIYIYKTNISYNEYIIDNINLFYGYHK